ncbi:MAG: hypothetical protein WCL61_02650 [bacterium]
MNHCEEEDKKEVDVLDSFCFKNIRSLILILGGINNARKILDKKIKVVLEVLSYIDHTLTITVNQCQSVEKLLEAGKFAFRAAYINSRHYPVPQKAKKFQQPVALFWFDGMGMVDTETVLAQMAKEGYRPATIWELLFLAIAYPELQIEFNIVALGTVYHHPDQDRVFLLYFSQRLPSVGEDTYKQQWRQNTRFLAVPKAKSK